MHHQLRLGAANNVPGLGVRVEKNVSEFFPKNFVLLQISFFQKHIVFLKTFLKYKLLLEIRFSNKLSLTLIKTFNIFEAFHLALVIKNHQEWP